MIFKVVLVAAIAVTVANSQSASTEVPTPAPTPATDEVSIAAVETATKPIEADSPATTAAVLSDGPAAEISDTPDVFLIGGLFEPGTEHIENVFHSALDETNIKRTLGSNRLKGRVEELELGDSFQASQSVCGLLSSGVLALYGPQSGASSAHVQSMASSLQVPHLLARVDFKPPGNHSVNLMPSPYVLARAFRDLVSKRNWKSYAIVYSTDESLLRIQEFLREESLRGKKMMIRRVENDNVKQVLQEIKFRGFRNILVDLSLADGSFTAFMKAAQERDMMTEYFNYVSTSPDLETAEIPPTDASIAAFSLIQKPSTYSAASALTFDAINLFSEALAELLKTKPIEKPALKCSLQDSWPYGQELRKQILKTRIQGMTGEVKFDEQGIRSDIKLRLLENIGENGKMKTVGSWTPADGIRVDEGHAAEIRERAARILKTKTLRVQRPLYQINDSSPISGFLSELLDVLQGELGFKITVESESMYGVMKANGQWSGMVGKLVNGTADIAVADLTITDQREKVIDFSVPFLETGIGILIKKSDVGNMTSVDDLAAQNTIIPTTIKHGSTNAFIQNSERTAIMAISKKIEETCPSPLVNTVAEGIAKAKSGGFAMFTEGLQLQAVVNQDCDMTMLGEPLNKVAYGIGLQKGSPYTSLFSQAIIKLKEAGKIEELRAKLWAKNAACESKP